jgi:hypothetical protein
MIMTSRLRKFALTAHLTVLVGWLGAAAAYLALAVVGLTTQDSEMASAAYRAMEVVGFAIIVPCSVAALLSRGSQPISHVVGHFERPVEAAMIRHGRGFCDPVPCLRGGKRG